MTPNKLKIDTIESTPTYAKYEIYPFPRGFGHTFATPMRRILLSSIKGTSLTSVKIKGVNHEFSTLKGLKEDVLRLVLNLQKVVFKLDSSDKEKVVLKVHGNKEVKASDIKVPGNVSIVNPDFVIGQLTDDSAQLELEAVLESGYGYEAVNDEVRNTDPGTIPLSKDFSPVDKVNFSIESTRVAQETDWEKIVLYIWTKGSVSPKSALEQACARFVEELNNLNEVVQSLDNSATNEKEKVEEEEEVK